MNDTITIHLPETDTPRNSVRFVVSFDGNGQPVTKEIPLYAFIMSPERFVDAMLEPNGIIIHTETLKRLVLAAGLLLGDRCAHYQTRAREQQEGSQRQALECHQ